MQQLRKNSLIIITILLAITGNLIISCSSVHENETSWTVKGSHLIKEVKPNGIKDIEQQYILDTIPNGYYREFYKNGKMSLEVNYLKGKKNGIIKTCFLNGQLEYLTYYIDGKKDSLEYCYYENGTLKAANFRLGGKYFGHQTSYYKNGKIKSIDVAVNDSEYFFNVQYDSLTERITKIDETLLFLTRGDERLRLGCSMGMMIDVVKLPKTITTLAVKVTLNHNRVLKDTLIKKFENMGTAYYYLLLDSIKFKGNYELYAKAIIIDSISKKNIKSYDKTYTFKVE